MLTNLLIYVFLLKIQPDNCGRCKVTPFDIGPIAVIMEETTTLNGFGSRINVTTVFNPHGALPDEALPGRALPTGALTDRALPGGELPVAAIVIGLLALLVVLLGLLVLSVRTYRTQSHGHKKG